MPKSAQSARRSNILKEPRRQLATQAARKDAPPSSHSIRQVRQGQELDPEFKICDIEIRN